MNVEHEIEVLKINHVDHQHNNLDHHVFLLVDNNGRAHSNQRTNVDTGNTINRRYSNPNGVGIKRCTLYNS